MWPYLSGFLLSNGYVNVNLNAMCSCTWVVSQLFFHLAKSLRHVVCGGIGRSYWRRDIQVVSFYKWSIVQVTRALTTQQTRFFNVYSNDNTETDFPVRTGTYLLFSNLSWYEGGGSNLQSLGWQPGVLRPRNVLNWIKGRISHDWTRWKDQNMLNSSY